MTYVIMFMTYVMTDNTRTPNCWNKSNSNLQTRHDMRQGSVYMNTESIENTTRASVEQTSLAETMKKMEETCNSCKPLSMLTCVTDCRIWKLKNESRELYKKMQNSNFTTDLLNTIKNTRRLEILQIISKGQYSIDRLQQELKKLGHNHSRKTITEEYIIPLIKVELAHEAQGKYYATAFGSKLNEKTKDTQNIGDLLPPHSECYEEKTLLALLNKPKTYEEFNGSISTKSIARVLSRLQAAGLVETNKEKDYVFFFKTQRNPNKEKLSPTEQKVHENIPEDGISAKKLAQRAQISLRRTYKYSRRLKGKKLVFTREKPKTYALTSKGLQIATTLQKLHNLMTEAQLAAAQLVKYETTPQPLRTEAYQTEKKKKTITPLQTIRSLYPRLPANAVPNSSQPEKTSC